MPAETKISEEFGRIVSDAMDSDSLGKAQIKTQISQAYLLAMKRGKVPSREVIQRFQEGYKDRVRLADLMLAAGYVEPADAAEALDMWIVTKHKKISPDKRKKIVETLSEIIRKYEEENG